MTTIRNWKKTLLGAIVTAFGLVTITFAVMAIGNWLFATKQEEGSCEREEAELKEAKTSKLLDYLWPVPPVLAASAAIGGLLYKSKRQPKGPGEEVTEQNILDYVKEIREILKQKSPIDVSCIAKGAKNSILENTEMDKWMISFSDEFPKKYEMARRVVPLVAKSQVAVITAAAAKPEEKNKLEQLAVKAVRETQEATKAAVVEGVEGVEAEQTYNQVVWSLRSITIRVTEELLPYVFVDDVAICRDLVDGMLRMRKDLNPIPIAIPVTSHEMPGDAQA